MPRIKKKSSTPNCLIGSTNVCWNETKKTKKLRWNVTNYGVAIISMLLKTVGLFCRI